MHSHELNDQHLWTINDFHGSDPIAFSVVTGLRVTLKALNGLVCKMFSQTIFETRLLSMERYRKLDTSVLFFSYVGRATVAASPSSLALQSKQAIDGDFSKEMSAL